MFQMFCEILLFLLQVFLMLVSWQILLLWREETYSCLFCVFCRDVFPKRLKVVVTYIKIVRVNFELQKEVTSIFLSNKMKIGFSDTKAKDEENLICARHGVTWMLRSRKMMSFCGSQLHVLMYL